MLEYSCLKKKVVLCYLKIILSTGAPTTVLTTLQDSALLPKIISLQASDLKKIEIH